MAIIPAIRGEAQWVEEGSAEHAALIEAGWEETLRRLVQGCFWAVLMVKESAA